MVDFNLLKKYVEENNTFLITTHVNPDADALGSALSFYGILKSLNKSAKIVNHSATPNNHEFLDPDSVVEQYVPEKHDDYIKNVDIIVVVDLNQLSRVVSMEAIVRQSNSPKICIDHHLDPENFAEAMFTSDAYSATAEIIYEFIEATNICEINYNMALQIYSAIMTDTGSFKYDRTTSKVHKIAAHLIDLGVKPEMVSDKIFAQNNFGRQKLLGYGLSSLTLSKSEKVCYMIVTRDDLINNGASESDLDGFVNYCLSIQGVRIGILFYELSNGIKISFRSKGEIPVNKLAGDFGGGGHLNASGTRIYDAKLSDYISKVIDKAEEYLD